MSSPQYEVVPGWTPTTKQKAAFGGVVAVVVAAAALVGWLMLKSDPADYSTRSSAGEAVVTATTPPPAPVAAAPAPPPVASVPRPEQEFMDLARANPDLNGIDDTALLGLGEHGCRIARTDPGSWGEAIDVFRAAGNLSEAEVQGVLEAASAGLCPGVG